MLLIGDGNSEWTTLEGLRKAKAFAAGIAPSKSIVAERPRLVQLAHGLDLDITLWIFKAGGTGQFASVREEMSYYLERVGVDALFTNNPDQFPR